MVKQIYKRLGFDKNKDESVEPSYYEVSLFLMIPQHVSKK